MDESEYLPPITVMRESGGIRVTCDSVTAVFRDGEAEHPDAPPHLLRIFRAVMDDPRPCLRAE